MALCEEYLKTKFRLSGNSHVLTEVKRQDDGSYVLKNAVAIREGIEKKSHKMQLQGIEKMDIGRATNAYIIDYQNNGYESVVSIGATHRMNSMFYKNIREKLFGITSKIIEKDELILITQTWKRNGFYLYSSNHVIVSEANHNNIEYVARLHFLPVKLISKSIDGKSETIVDYLLLESILHPEGLALNQEKRLRFER